MSFNLFNQSNLEFLKSQPDNSIDSIVTDPPYGISFMGKSWDYDVPNVETWKELMRVLKSGGHILVACGTRTQHRMAVNIEDAGFEIRDIVAWVYGSGFPKSLNIGKAVDKLQGNEREVVGENPNHRESDALYELGFQGGKGDGKITKGNSPYEGWGTALKPAMELWTLARKPLSEKTVAENVLKWGTGGINIDGSRVEVADNEKESFAKEWDREQSLSADKSYSGKYKDIDLNDHRPTGRFPANFIHDGSDEVVDMFPETKSTQRKNGQDYDKASANINIGGGFKNHEYTDSGSASRFFYCAKASKSERNAGCNHLPMKSGGSNAKGYTEDVARGLDRNRPTTNFHPTVKPVALMRYLVKLITPTGGIVLDPFMGSGSTGIACVLEGFNFIGVEMNKEYFEIAKARIEHWTVN